LQIIKENFLVGAGYWALAEVMREYFSAFDMWPAPLWMPAGIALFAMIWRGPRRICAGIILGSLLTNLVSFRQSPVPAVILAVSTALSAGVAGSLLRRSKPRALFSSIRGVLFFELCAFLTGGISAAVFVATLLFSRVDPGAAALKALQWTSSDAAGCLLITPLLWLLVNAGPTLAEIKGRPWEFGACMCAALLALIDLFYGSSGNPTADAGATFVLLLPLLWLAVRFSLAIALTALLAVIAATVGGTVLDWGPYAHIEHGRTFIVFAQIANGFGSAVLLLGGATSEQRLAKESLRQLNRELENRVEVRTAELRASQARLERAAFYDALTGLPNRRLLEKRLAITDVGHRRKRDPFAFLVLDLDHFKEINDTMGHDAGDEVLVEFGRRLTSALREDDTVARLGGDEFAILLPNTAEQDNIEHVCQRLLKCASSPIYFQGQPLHISTSIGVARFPEDGEAWNALYKAADLALYEAKRAGRNGFRRSGEVSRDTREEQIKT
jgi:diguanylate cyclase (GGDEF)-like protein